VPEKSEKEIDFVEGLVCLFVSCNFVLRLFVVCLLFVCISLFIMLILRIYLLTFLF